VGLSQAGAQDFGAFRQILEEGGIPAPEVLDPIGFFAEHKLDFPKPTCGAEVCLHGLLGVSGNMVTGTNCTLIQIGMNTPLDPATLERPPLHLVLAIDTSGSMVGKPMDYVIQGLLEMVPELEEGDLVSLVRYSSAAQILLEAVPATDPARLEQAIKSLSAAGQTNLYDGLFTAFALAQAHREAGRETRVVFLSDGKATAGIQTPGALASLAESYVETGIGLTSIGVGTEFDVTVMQDLAEVGAGNFYFLEDPSAVTEVFTEEVKTFLYPVALDVTIDVSVGAGYLLRRVYGTTGWTAEGARKGEIHIPSLFLAGRKDADEPIDQGRRGGGGGVLVELVPKYDHAGIEDLHEVGDLGLTWTDPRTGEVHTQEVPIDNALVPGDTPEGGMWTDPTVEKGFVALNILAAFEMGTALVLDGDTGSARAVVEAVRDGVAEWLEVHDDLDIADDLVYLNLLLTNLQEVAAQTPPPAVTPEPWPMGD
jgi:Ca-activated chloride channel family protein